MINRRSYRLRLFRGLEQSQEREIDADGRANADVRLLLDSGSHINVGVQRRAKRVRCNDGLGGKNSHTKCNTAKSPLAAL
jgi:hypothetical protein